jgi:hypothetical protein
MVKHGKSWGDGFACLTAHYSAEQAFLCKECHSRSLQLTIRLRDDQISGPALHSEVRHVNVRS